MFWNKHNHVVQTNHDKLMTVFYAEIGNPGRDEGRTAFRGEGRASTGWCRRRQPCWCDGWEFWKSRRVSDWSVRSIAHIVHSSIPRLQSARQQSYIWHTCPSQGFQPQLVASFIMNKPSAIANIECWLFWQLWCVSSSMLLHYILNKRWVILVATAGDEKVV